MGTNWIIKTTCLAFSLITGSAFAQYGSPQPNYHQQQAAAQYQRELEMMYVQQAQQRTGYPPNTQNYQAVDANGYPTNHRNPDVAGRLPVDPHAQVQLEYARQRAIEERMYAQQRIAAQHQYQPAFPRQLPMGRSVGFRRRQDDPFGESRAREVNQEPQEDPFGERELPPPPPQQQPQIPPQNPPGQEPDIDAFADPPVQDIPRQPVPQDSSQQPVPQELPEPNNQQPFEQVDPFGERPGTESVPPVLPGRDEVTAPPQQTPDEAEYPPGAITPDMFDSQDENEEKQSIVVPDVNQPENGMDSPQATPVYPPAYPPSYEPGYPQMEVPPGYYPDQHPQYGAPMYGQPAYGEPNYPYYGQPVQNGVPQQPYFDEQYSAAAAGVYNGVVCNEGAVVSPQDCNLGLPQYGCPNFYLSVFGGGVFLNDLHDYNNTAFLDNGGAVGVALGQRHGCNLRSELEFTFRSNGVGGSQLISPYNQVFYQDLDGEINAYSGMTNFYWEFTNFPRRCIKPYVGAGIGFVSIDSRIYDEYERNLLPDQEDTTSFAYQFIGGVNYKTCCNVDLFIEYRYFAADSFRIHSNYGWPGGKHEYQSSNLFAGVRWKF